VHTVDVILVCVAIALLIVVIAVLARQRFMLRATGALPFAVQRGNRWLYGIGRYVEDELRWYRALGIGTRPTRVLRRGEVEVIDRRAPSPADRGALPATAVVVECRTGGEVLVLAIGESAFTGFVSWLESSAPL
jgi:hypothetical protein